MAERRPEMNFVSRCRRTRGRRRRRGAIAGCLLALWSNVSAMAQDAGTKTVEKDWPCRQILVESISLPAIWQGPPIDHVDWRKNPAIMDLVNKLAIRRLPIEEAERAIQDFAGGFGPSREAEKKTALIILFAGLFETLNNERSQVIAGLVRFGRKQKDLAEKIRTENAAIHAPPQAETPSAAASAQRLEWDLRVFDERRQSLTYVCESPTLIEQRLFALARIIQQNLD